MKILKGRPYAVSNKDPVLKDLLQQLDEENLSQGNLVKVIIFSVRFDTVAEKKSDLGGISTRNSFTFLYFLHFFRDLFETSLFNSLRNFPLFLEI